MKYHQAVGLSASMVRKEEMYTSLAWAEGETLKLPVDIRCDDREKTITAAEVSFLRREAGLLRPCFIQECNRAHVSSHYPHRRHRCWAP